MKPRTNDNALAEQIYKQLRTLPKESLVKVAEYIETLRPAAHKPARKTAAKPVDELEKQRILERVREIERRTKKYLTLEEARRAYEKKWGVNLDDIEPEADD